MSNQFIIKDFVVDILKANSLGVLATEGNGQPHASLVAVTQMDDLVHLIFATYRNTLKYRNLKDNKKVAILFDNRNDIHLSQTEIAVVTAFGEAKEVRIGESESVFHAHLLQHPEFEPFFLSADCVLFQVKVAAYQVVRGVDDITWLKIEDLKS
jgi:nitroimidazol reductase NimA-like FMN-containing flavoprotein (pyridoxamine 5'-phosphate oxidase superfamily)